MNEIYFQHFTGLLLPDESSPIVMGKLRTNQQITFRVDLPLTQTVPTLKKIFINDKELCATTCNIFDRKPTKKYFKIKFNIVYFYSYRYE